MLPELWAAGGRVYTTVHVDHPVGQANQVCGVAMTTRVLVALKATVAAAVGVLGIGVSLAPAALADPPYASCKVAAADVRYNIPWGDPAYRQALGRDNDGIACER